jgi:hypothetical protein
LAIKNSAFAMLERPDLLLTTLILNRIMNQQTLR